MKSLFLAAVFAVFLVGCEDKKPAPKGIEVNAPGVNLKVGEGGVDVKVNK